jgi:hypothetical protein
VGNSQGIIFHSALMELAHLKAGGTVTLTPLRPRPSPAEVSKVIKSTMTDYARTAKKLA